MKPSASTLIFPAESEWLAARRGFITASETAALVGCSPYSSMFSVWASKVQPEPQQDNRFMRFGRKLEPVAAECYAEETGARLIDLGRWTLCVGEQPHLAATLDRIILDLRPEPGILELKATHLADAWEQSPPLHVIVQLQTQLAVTGYSWGAVGVLIGGNDFRHFEVERNEELIEVIHDAVAAFWPFVERREMPDVDGSEPTFEAVKRMFPRDSGREIVVAEEKVINAFVALENFRRIAKKAEEGERAAKSIILAACQDAGVAVVNGERWAIGTVRKQSYTVAAQEYRTVARAKRGRNEDG